MRINKETKIKYTLKNKKNEESYIILSLEQIEGSKPYFYSQLGKIFNPKIWEIVEREIIEEAKENKNNVNIRKFIIWKIKI